jgi:hypothetical protein
MLRSRLACQNRLGGLVALAGLALSLTPALAMPPVMDRVPKDAVAAVTVANFDAFRKDLENLGTLMQLPVQEGLKQFMPMGGMDKGLKMDGPVTVIVLKPSEPAKAAEPKKKDEMGGEDDADGADPFATAPVVVIVQTKGYAAMLEGFGVKPGGGIDAVMIDGEQVFTKDIGDSFAAVAPRKELLEKFSGQGGNLAGHKALAGAAGDKLADKSDLFIYVNMPVAQPLLDKSIDDGAKNMAANMGAMGGEGPNMEAGQKFAKSVVADTTGLVAGLTIDNLGVALDLVANFKEGTRFAKLTAKPGTASALLGKLPNMPYLAALALDTSSPELRAFRKELEQLQPAALSKEQQATQAAAREVLDKADGTATIIGVSPAGLMGGLLVNSVNYMKTSDAPGVIAAQRKSFSTMVESKLAEGKYEEASTDVNGTKVDSYAFRMLPSNEDPSAAMMMGMFFGPGGGPSGYSTKVDGGVVTTFSKNSGLMTNAMNAAKGENALGQDKLLGQIGEKLPQGRIAEVFVSTKDLLGTVLPMAAMFGMPINADIPQNLPPIGLAIAPNNGSAQASIYLPAPVLKTMAEVAKQIQPPGGGGGPGEDNSGTGQPKF